MKLPKTTLSVAVIAALAAVATTSSADAQNPRRGYDVGVAGQGSDMWTQAMSGLRLFTPHRDNCDTTEVFVKVYENSNSVNFGFCIDKDEHPDGPAYWDDARHKCLAEGKRLPEPGEYRYACDNAGTLGINNMTDDNELVSNFWQLMRKPYSDWWRGIMSPSMGNGACNRADHQAIGISSNTDSVTAFRCVR